MADLQELISRGRFIFNGSPKRLEVFKLINGKRTSKDISLKTGRSLSAISQELQKLRDLELIQPKEDNEGNIIKKGPGIVYEVLPLIRHVPISYSQDVVSLKHMKKKTPKKIRAKSNHSIHIPSETEILDISKQGENQVYEFKTQGTDIKKITKELAAFIHTKNGGIVFYGIEDDGSIVGTDIKRQDFDNRIHNSIKNTLSSAPNIELKERTVLGVKLLLIIVPPWDKKTLCQYTPNGGYYIRKGTNVFALKPDEMKKLMKGEYVV